MRRLLQVFLLAILGMGLVACGPTKKSVYPPSISIQQLLVLPNGQWQLTVRIQNNSYGEMDFRSIEGLLQVAKLMPVRLHANFKRDIPALNGDVIQLELLPTDAMNHALQAVASKGSAGAIDYRISGSASAKPEQEDKIRVFDFSGNDWLSAAPGIPNTFR